MELDKIAPRFGCISVALHRSAEDKGLFSPACEFGFVPIDVTTGCVHRAQRDTAILAIGKTVARAATYHSIYDAISKREI